MASTKRREPSLTELRDWCEDRANDPLETRDNRDMWQALADEYTARLGDRNPETQEELLLWQNSPPPPSS
jgi:hypothetical protein